MLRLLSFQQEKDLAHSLSNQIVKMLPPQQVRERLHTISANRIVRVLEQVIEKAAQSQEKKRGFLARAILANSLRWELRDAGYPKEFLDIAIEGLIVRLTQPNY